MLHPAQGLGLKFEAVSFSPKNESARISLNMLKLYEIK